jgi:hypothetical protein
MCRVLVCGGRDYKDRARLETVLASWRPTVVIEGGCRTGADRFAHDYAQEKGIPLQTYYARWQSEGKAAGPKRNQRMLDEGKPDVVLAFPGGRGTADMVRRARAAGIVYCGVIEVDKPR